MGGELQAGIRLTGTPVLNAEQITFPDLQFSIETDDRLARVTAWLLRIGLPNYARRRVSISTGEALAWGRALLGELDLQLSGGTRLRAELGAIEIVGLAASSDALIVRSRARPEAFLQLKPDDFALSTASGRPVDWVDRPPSGPACAGRAFASCSSGVFGGLGWKKMNRFGSTRCSVRQMIETSRSYFATGVPELTPRHCPSPVSRCPASTTDSVVRVGFVLTSQPPNCLLAASWR